jgi:hypothetical protein
VVMPMDKKMNRRSNKDRNKTDRGPVSENRPKQTENELTPEEADDAGLDAIDPTREKKLPEEIEEDKKAIPPITRSKE